MLYRLQRTLCFKPPLILLLVTFLFRSVRSENNNTDGYEDLESEVDDEDVDLVVMLILMVVFLFTCVIISLPVNTLERLFTSKPAHQIFDHEDDPCIMWVLADTIVPEADSDGDDDKDESFFSIIKDRKRRSQSLRSSRKLHSNYYLYGVLRR